MSAAVEAPRGAKSPTFTSSEEMREVLSKLFAEIERDPEIGCPLHEAGTAYRLSCPDLDFVVNVAPDREEGCDLRWEFSDDVDWRPGLAMEASAEIANRVLQGRENLAIAIARGRVKLSCDTRSALRFFELTKPVVYCYRDLVAREYPHLALS